MRTSSLCVVPAMKQRRNNRGHMLVLPTEHIVRLIDVERFLLQDLYAAAARVSIAMTNAFGATGATLFQNDNAPDQTLFHLHIHVVPRTAGDNFQLPDATRELVSHEERRHQARVLSRALS